MSVYIPVRYVSPLVREPSEQTSAYRHRFPKTGLSAASNEAAENGTAERSDNSPKTELLKDPTP
jgi:hypothetical protein